VLLVDGRDVAPLELADTYGTRRRGLLKRDGVEGAFWLRPCRHVHTFGMRFAIDVALVDGDGTVLHTQTMPPGRLGAVRRACRSVIEAEAGAFARWGLAAGARVEAHD
jgi:uncharacterized membrane protein (UPF0127 family)